MSRVFHNPEQVVHHYSLLKDIFVPGGPVESQPRCESVLERVPAHMVNESVGVQYERVQRNLITRQVVGGCMQQCVATEWNKKSNTRDLSHTVTHSFCNSLKIFSIGE